MNRTKVSKENMKNPNGDRFDGRLKAASEAKKKQLEQFKVAADDPKLLAKRAKMQEVAAARDVKHKAKAEKLLKEKEALALQEAEAAELKAAQDALRKTEVEAEKAKAAEQEVTKDVTSEAARKAERDRRYAARRNRKR